MNYRFTQHRSATFSETDLAGIVHFASFFPYMEDCEHAFYRSLGYSVHNMDDGEGGTVAWPRVHASCDYKKPLYFEDKFEIEMLVSNVKDKTIKYIFNFWSADTEKILYATGSVVVVCVRFVQSQIESIFIPDSIRDRIVAAPSKLLDEVK